MRITILVENTACGEGILGEHGLAVWIETESHCVLFDTGQGLALRHNAEALGIDLARANAIVLSHGPFFLDEEMTRPDPLADDQALFLPTAEGLVVIFGCAHAGVVNTLAWIEKVEGELGPIRLLLGGLHLPNASEWRMEETITSLAARQPKQMVFCHCTGSQAVCRREREFPGRNVHGHAGLVLDL